MQHCQSAAPAPPAAHSPAAARAWQWGQQSSTLLLPGLWVEHKENGKPSAVSTILPALLLQLSFCSLSRIGAQRSEAFLAKLKCRKAKKALGIPAAAAAAGTVPQPACHGRAAAAKHQEEHRRSTQQCNAARCCSAPPHPTLTAQHPHSAAPQTGCCFPKAHLGRAK